MKLFGAALVFLQLLRGRVWWQLPSTCAALGLWELRCFVTHFHLLEGGRAAAADAELKGALLMGGGGEQGVLGAPDVKDGRRGAV